MSDKTVLITGCSSGIGRATAKTFVAEGEWVVYATARDTADIAHLAELGCETAQLDVTDDEDIERVIEQIDGHTGRVDCLVNNAGFAQCGPLEDVSVGRLHRQFDVNVYGPHRLTRAVLPLMRLREEGTIINVSSVYGRLSMPGVGPYSASKFAVEALSDALRGEVDGFGIDVVLIEPGPVDTNLWNRIEHEVDGLSQSSEYEWVYETVADSSTTFPALPLALEPEDVAAAIHDAAVVSNPKTRYPIGPIAKFAIYGSFLPDRVHDAVFRLVRRFA